MFPGRLLASLREMAYGTGAPPTHGKPPLGAVGRRSSREPSPPSTPPVSPCKAVCGQHLPPPSPQSPLREAHYVAPNGQPRKGLKMDTAAAEAVDEEQALAAGKEQVVCSERPQAGVDLTWSIGAAVHVANA
jgi:hypothetical protein